MDSPISQLPPAAALAGSELVPVVQGGVTVKATVRQLLALPVFTVATLPDPTTVPYCMVFVSDGTANKRLAVSDGAAWRWPDGAVVS